ncbi:MAG: 4Fe-4S binding protein [Deltaproteobacteria bacterium]|nr:4Fe-4S binding protein [Deltaproteobacteria bacterium]MBT4262926.1 4Fe-4S binding protein [Deltaproteobacteria bacterium]MBT4641734.1 4Fe-4S binding protein [Deltaproteobacteria bacterium]MBT6504631.1 4Fe-4S binding protein [Deltaproteobacteria bacterium]MBT6613026.1 4Fe-4S binding protein [Deltaproteobacteria bacterium]
MIEDRCVGCSLCVPICPEEALSCYGLVIVNEYCTDCLECIEFCPVGAFQEPEQGE